MVSCHFITISHTLHTASATGFSLFEFNLPPLSPVTTQLSSCLHHQHVLYYNYSIITSSSLLFSIKTNLGYLTYIFWSHKCITISSIIKSHIFLSLIFTYSLFTNSFFFPYFSISLTGTLPHTLGNLISLKSMILKNNQLRGKLPSSFGKLKSLEEMDLGYNSLSGTYARLCVRT